MPEFEVSPADGSAVRIEAANWLSALGDGLDELGVVEALERLACEVLPNGRVIARDVRTGQGFVVMPLLGDDARTDETVPSQPLPSEVGPDGVHPGWEQDQAELFAALPDEEEEDEESDDVLSVGEYMDTEEVTAGITLGGKPLPGRALQRVQRVLEAPSALIAWHEALDAAQSLVPAEAGAALERELGGQLRFLYAFGPRSSGVQGAVLPRGIGIAGFSVERSLAVLVQDTRTDPRFCNDFDDVTGFDTQAVICVPVTCDRQVHGCLELLNPLVPGGFDERAVALVEAVATALSRRLSSP